MKQKWTIAGQNVDIEVSRHKGGVTVTTGGQTFEVIGRKGADGVLHLTIDGRPVRVVTGSDGTSRFVAVGGLRLTGSKVRAGRRSSKKGDDASGLTSPMPGQVLKVVADAGDRVARGDTLMIIEAMKMEHAIKAPWDGVVAAIHFSEGDMVTPGAALAEVTAAPDGTDES